MTTRSSKKGHADHQHSHDGNVTITGARTHNLQEVSLSFPRDAMVVFTGVSGSGKSSLAFDTIYAEAQQRYLESVAPHARRLIEQIAAPDADDIQGLPPAVALKQSRGGTQERSTVGSMTRIAVNLRLLYSRAGKRPADVPFMTAEAFSPNNPQGACPVCHGIGVVPELNRAALVPDRTLSIREGAIAAWPVGWHGKNLRTILEMLDYDVDAPWDTLPEKQQQWILFTDEQPSTGVYPGLNAAQRQKAIAAGVEPDYRGTYTSPAKYVLQNVSGGKDSVKKRLSRFVTIAPCSACHGKRLNPDALTVTFAGHDIAALGEMTIRQLKSVLLPYAEKTSADLPDEAALREAVIRLTRDIVGRLDQLEALGLGHLSLGRRTTMLSSGELQRIRLATQMISKLFGVLYVLDEPSAGLHPEDVAALMPPLRSLLAAGNSLLIVEHNLDVIAEADWVVEVGPGPGRQGGNVVYNGEPAGLKHIATSATARYLFNEQRPPLREHRAPNAWLSLKNVACNNLNALDVDFPLASMTVITGVSGSGKSTLLTRVIPGLLSQIDNSDVDEEQDDEALKQSVRGEVAAGGEALKRLVRIDQRPIGRTPRSNLATYTGFFDTVRKLFADTPQAKKRGFDAGRFSFNLPEGRCPVCEGQGVISIELLFMPEASAPCTACGGKRYNDETLAVKWQHLSIADILALTVDDAVAVFQHNEPIQRSLSALTALGLGYLTLGQPATELSGGECQRIKLARELQRVQRGNGLYLLDEPSSGLHPADMDKLVLVLDQLIQRGNTVIMAEHDMRIAAEADWVIDLGPGSGDNGGQVVAAGSPAQVSASANSRTAPYLKKRLHAREA
ncbi:excinuclease ABC subunit UvrA (plasmid) [Duffyella gerundensis]|uniref:excinuclease ABC subunit UvrA n=1 Tax=Duffyella gerundensis TaxID=1619313 RepID=UPI001CE2E062|nr:excinuclease ABC subunit UvrA [Duffyella gerundensis]UCB32943.1 excinuclease ABC subunit UvrA [Duffyella gerundensis]